MAKVVVCIGRYDIENHNISEYRIGVINRDKLDIFLSFAQKHPIPISWYTKGTEVTTFFEHGHNVSYEKELQKLRFYEK